mmetsp:Transcript_7272/g.32079  ORF Transcript_7272/g.32079 Transcript_7272/m.32079 type:complete len:240 (+) Transcript_7272:335-1054(+)
MASFVSRLSSEAIRGTPGLLLLLCSGENVLLLGFLIPANSTTLTVERPAMSWQNTARSPGTIRPSSCALVSASTSVLVAPTWCTTGAVSSSSVGVDPTLSAGTTPRYTSCCLASTSPSTLHCTVPPWTVGIDSDSTGHCGWYLATSRVVSPVCENTTMTLASIWYAVCTAAAASASFFRFTSTSNCSSLMVRELRRALGLILARSGSSLTSGATPHGSESVALASLTFICTICRLYLAS